MVNAMVKVLRRVRVTRSPEEQEVRVNKVHRAVRVSLLEKTQRRGDLKECVSHAWREGTASTKALRQEYAYIWKNINEFSVTKAD